MNLCRRSLLLFCIFAIASTARGNVVAFGDNLVDVGNVALAGGFPFPPGSPYFPGQFSNGPVWVQTFASELGLPATQPSLAGGKNFAFAAATAAPDPTALVPSVAEQVTQYLALNSVTISTDYHVLWAGGNDAIRGLASLSPSEVPAGIPVIANRAAGSIVDSARQLADAGAQKTFVSNLSSLGDLPLTRASGPLQVAAAKAYTEIFNETLDVGLDQLEQELGLSIARLDQIALYAEIENDPGKFGLTNLDDPALAIDLDPSSPDFGNPQLPFSVVENQNEYFWFDSVHPTAATHQIVGQAAANAVPEPSSRIVWLLLFALAIGRRKFVRRR